MTNPFRYLNSSPEAVRPMEAFCDDFLQSPQVLETDSGWFDRARREAPARTAAQRSGRRSCD